jgi:hypothetical protein
VDVTVVGRASSATTPECLDLDSRQTAVDRQVDTGDDGDFAFQ